MDVYLVEVFDYTRTEFDSVWTTFENALGAAQSLRDMLVKNEGYTPTRASQVVYVTKAPLDVHRPKYPKINSVQLSTIEKELSTIPFDVES